MRLSDRVEVQDATIDRDVLLPVDAMLAHYRIVCRIGAGAMGTVYKAYDSQLERHVALKVLHPGLLHDRDKVQRFAQEAKAASALNHPAIVTIYEVATAHIVTGSESGADAIQYIAMEYVDGPSLREYFDEEIALPKMLDVIVQVAEGMAKAHAAGVVHRDLKPDNIVMTPERAPKIVDFGLAKLIQADLFAGVDAEAPTLNLPQTRTGMVIGTVGYMAPEQVEGRPADQRSDIFSLGCILYEAVTGRNPFPGNSVIAILHEILYGEPSPIADLEPAAPPDLERVVRRCLAKDPDNRYQSIREVAIEIRQLRTGSAPVAARQRRTHRTAMASAFAAATLFAAALIAVLAYERSRPAELETVRFTPFATDATYEGFPAWSPDGKSIAYIAEVAGVMQVFVRAVDAAQGTQITHAVRDCREPFWDTRGNRIFYISLAQDRDSLWSVSVGGGQPEVFLKNVHTGAISPDGKTLATLREDDAHGNFALALWMSSPPEATPKPYDRPPLRDARFATGYIRFAPDNSKWALWARMRGTTTGQDDRAMWIIPRHDGNPHTVMPSLLRASSPFPFSWMPDSRQIIFSAEFLLPATGMHLWSGDTETGRLRPLTRTGGVEYYPSVSPDGERVIFSTEEADFDLMYVPIDGSAASPFLATARSERNPTWSPKNDEYAYVTDRTGSPEIWMASGNGQWRKPLITAKDFENDLTYGLADLAFSPEGQRIAYQRRGVHRYQIWISSIAGGPPAPVAVSEGFDRYEERPTWSPDGNWIAFTQSNMKRENFKLVKARPGSGSMPIVIKEDVLYPSTSQWSPRGDWITVDVAEGFGIVSPDGSKTRLLSEQSMIVHAWSRDGNSVYGIRLNDDLHLTLTKIDVESGRETLVGDLGASAPMIDPVDGFSMRSDGQSFLTSVPHLKSDLWIVDGFNPPQTAFERLLHARLP
jgi:Tol biopolymer transport system component/predicted Ser/Thr protein kinase